MTMLLVIFDCATQPGIRDLQGASFLLGEAWILERGKNVIEFRFQFLKLCTEHTTPFPPRSRHRADCQVDLARALRCSHQETTRRLRSGSRHEFLSCQT